MRVESDIKNSGSIMDAVTRERIAADDPKTSKRNRNVLPSNTAGDAVVLSDVGRAMSAEVQQMPASADAPDPAGIFNFAEAASRRPESDTIGASLEQLRKRWDLSGYVGGLPDADRTTTDILTGLAPEDAKVFWNAYDSVGEGFATFAEMANRARKDYELAVMGESIRQQAMAKIDYLASGVFAGKPATVGLLRSQVDLYYGMWTEDFSNYMRETQGGDGAKGLALITPDGKVNSAAMPALMNFSVSLNSIVNTKPDRFAVEYDRLLDMVRSAAKLEKVKSMDRGGVTPSFMDVDFPNVLAKDWDEFIWMLPGDMSDKPFTSRFVPT